MKASGPEVTVTVAVPEKAPLVALMVFTYVPGVAPAVNNPAASIAPPPVCTDQVGLMANEFPFASLPTAVNCCVAVTAIEAGLGLTTIEASAPALTVTVAV